MMEPPLALGRLTGACGLVWLRTLRKIVVAVTIAVIFAATLYAVATPRGKWVEVRSPNFIVVSNAGESQARKTAEQFEQVRTLYRDSLAYVKASSSPVITILAVKDEDSLRELLPEFWAEKNRVHPAGIFLGGFNQLQIAINVAAPGDNPYETIYHEYYHSVSLPYFPGIPLWVAEGMADFYGNSVIKDKTANLGMPADYLIAVLRGSKLMPLNELFKVDHTSPYYNEQSKVSIFYAESWALTHYLMLGDNRAHTQAFGIYLSAISQGANQDEAAAKAFGDLGKLQENLERYISRLAFPINIVPAPAKVPDGDLRVRSLSDAEVDAYSGGFLAWHGQFKDAEPLLKEAAQLDPRLALAQRNLALMHYLRQEHSDALASASAAIALDSQDPTMRYLRAQLLVEGSPGDPQIEEDLREALASEPNFASADGLLAWYLAANNEKLPEALTLGQKAVSLEPGNASLQLQFAQVLVRSRRYDDAETLARHAQANATDSRVRAAAVQFLTYVGQARDSDAHVRQAQEAAAARTSASDSVARSGDGDAKHTLDIVSDDADPVLKRRDAGASVEGVVSQVRADDNAKSVTYTPDGHGLEKQYQSFLDAYNSGDTDFTGLASRLAVFDLPQENGWLSQYFGSEGGTKLKESYDRVLATYQKSFPTIMTRLWGKGTHFQIKCSPYSPKSDSKSSLVPKADAPVPLTEVPLQMYEVTFTADTVGSSGGSSFSHIINVVYVDGAYRFLGQGAYPFWSMPDLSRAPKPTVP